MNTDTQSRQIGDEDNPTVAVRLVGYVFPFQNQPENNITKGQLITVMGSGLIGALVYTFSDTFWFSAVEGEVYAFSSLFTAVVFLLILKWEDVADQPHSDRWIILIEPNSAINEPLAVAFGVFL